jgi:hypothetical protein
MLHIPDGHSTSDCDAEPQYAGTPCSAQHDSGQHDSGQHDSGQHDSGQHDSGQHDSGQHDSGHASTTMVMTLCACGHAEH